MTIEYICEWGKGDPEIKEELIRCKDCTYSLWHYVEADDSKHFECDNINSIYLDVSEDDYCSRAERKGNA